MTHATQHRIDYARRAVKPTACLAAAVLCIIGFAHTLRADVVTQDFESYGTGSSLTGDNGWTHMYGSTGDFTIQAPGGTGNTSLNAVSTAGSNTQMYAPVGFNPLTSADTNVFISANLRPLFAGNSSQQLYYSVGAATANTSHLFGRVGMASVNDNTANVHKFQFEFNNTLSPDTVTAGDWYTMQLRITVNHANLAASTGTVYIRDLTAGDTDFHTPTGLDNLTVDLSTIAPQDWADWYLRGQYAGQVDNLTFGTVPEPASLGLVLIGAGLVGFKRRHR